MPRKYNPWARAEYDRLETLINQDWRYADIAADMGRDLNSVMGAAQRLGLMSRERHAWRLKKDWQETDRILTDCIEARMMTVPQAHSYMASIGKPIALGLLYRRLKTMPLDVRRRARSNALLRMTAVCHRVHRRRQSQSA